MSPDIRIIGIIFQWLDIDMIRFHVTWPVHADACIAKAFQTRETEDLEATVLGHSILKKSKELVSLHNFLVTQGQAGSAQDSHFTGAVYWDLTVIFIIFEIRVCHELSLSEA